MFFAPKFEVAGMTFLHSSRRSFERSHDKTPRTRVIIHAEEWNGDDRYTRLASSAVVAALALWYRRVVVEEG
jgi:hypothetical protein